MNENTERGTISRTKFRLETGLDVLDEWSQTAGQSRKNAVYQALFAMQDGSLFRRYRIIDDFQRPNELFVIVKDDLVVKIRVNCFDSFGIVHIGQPGSSPAEHGES
jgi:hypothetical protein